MLHDFALSSTAVVLLCLLHVAFGQVTYSWHGPGYVEPVTDPNQGNGEELCVHECVFACVSYLQMCSCVFFVVFCVQRVRRTRVLAAAV